MFDPVLRFSYFLISVEALSIAGQIFLRSSSYEPGFRDLALPLPRCVHMRGQAVSVPEISVFSNRDLGKACFKRRATAVLSWLDFSSTVARH